MSEALEILKSCDAFLEGHFLLSSGRHSSAYCQMAYLQQYPDRCAEVMKAVADQIKKLDVDVIVGPAMGGIVYAYELARQTGKRAIFTAVSYTHLISGMFSAWGLSLTIRGFLPVSYTHLG